MTNSVENYGRQSFKTGSSEHEACSSEAYKRDEDENRGTMTTAMKSTGKGENKILGTWGWHCYGLNTNNNNNYNKEGNKQINK